MKTAGTGPAEMQEMPDLLGLLAASRKRLRLVNAG
jgi:hypothetical protein